MNERDRVLAAISKTPREYFEKCLAMRAGTNHARAGSYFADRSPAEVEKILQSAQWSFYDHKSVLKPGIAFRAEVGGIVDLVDLQCLEDQIPVALLDPKQTGFAEAAVATLGREQSVQHTTILLGPGIDGEEIVWSFFPGDPVTPSKVPATEESTVSVADALSMGLRWAKVCPAFVNDEMELAEQVRNGIAGARERAQNHLQLFSIRQRRHSIGLLHLADSLRAYWITRRVNFSSSVLPIIPANCITSIDAGPEREAHIVHVAPGFKAVFGIARRYCEQQEFDEIVKALLFEFDHSK